jgi:hypothetical protein
MDDSPIRCTLSTGLKASTGGDMKSGLFEGGRRTTGRGTSTGNGGLETTEPVGENM